jgi:hypothetical protein
MKEWELEDARKHLDAVAHLAVTKGPQRISTGSEAVVADEYDRIEPTEPPYDERGEPMNLVEFMQDSPLAEAFREGAFTEEEWDAACRMGGDPCSTSSTRMSCRSHPSRALIARSLAGPKSSRARSSR